MKTKPFNLEEALNGAKVVTRNGHEVKELTKFKGLKDYPLAGILFDSLASWTIDGFYFDTPEHNLDLFLAVQPQTKWVNLYKDVKGNFCFGQWCHSLEEAKNFIDPRMQYIKTIEITDEL